MRQDAVAAVPKTTIVPLATPPARTGGAVQPRVDESGIDRIEPVSVSRAADAS
jgi:hypothetical protein